MAKVCSFSADSHYLSDLAQMSDKEKLEYCTQATMFGDTDAQVVTLD